MVTETGARAGFRKFPYRTLLFYLIAVLQTVWFLMLQTPEISGDITGETVQTFLAENAVYNVNPMTGSAFTQGMPARFKILGLPTFTHCSAGLRAARRCIRYTASCRL